MIKLFITGGTIDKRYDELSGEVVFDKKSYISQMLKQGRCEVEIELETLFLKDSLDLSHKDRKRIYQAVKNCNEKNIIITHGTDTMVKSAKYLGKKSMDKTIIFVGSMIPHTVKNSDALFNLGTAIGAISILPQGVYIAMNGKIFDYNNVLKNRKIGIFYKK